MTLPSDRPDRRRRRTRRFRKVPLRLMLPNLVTLLALSLGLTAIRFAAEGLFELAVYAIIAAAVLDGVDGRLARALQGTSRFGAELDSLADFLDFGVAPALTLYFWSLSTAKNFGWFAAMVFVIACALRLARFNVALDDPNKPAWMSQFFTGMPAPAGAIVALMPLYLHLSVIDLVPNRAMVIAEIVYILIVAGLMASRIPHWSGKAIGRVPREHVILVMFAIAVVVLLLASFPMEMMIVLTLVYLVNIPLGIRRYRRLQRMSEQSASPTAPGGDGIPPPDTVTGLA